MRMQFRWPAAELDDLAGTRHPASSMSGLRLPLYVDLAVAASRTACALAACRTLFHRNATSLQRELARVRDCRHRQIASSQLLVWRNAPGVRPSSAAEATQRRRTPRRHWRASGSCRFYRCCGSSAAKWLNSLFLSRAWVGCRPKFIEFGLLMPDRVISGVSVRPRSPCRHSAARRG